MIKIGKKVVIKRQGKKSWPISVLGLRQTDGQTGGCTDTSTFDNVKDHLYLWSLWYPLLPSSFVCLSCFVSLILPFSFLCFVSWFLFSLFLFLFFIFLFFSFFVSIVLFCFSYSSFLFLILCFLVSFPYFLVFILIFLSLLSFSSPLFTFLSFFYISFLFPFTLVLILLSLFSSISFSPFLPLF